jgi:hypothetical protein
LATLTAHEEVCVATKSNEASAALEEASRLLAQVTKLLGDAPFLTAKERRAAAKMPRGGHAIVRAVATLSDRVRVNAPGYPTATMLADLAEAESLVMLHSALALATKQVDDRIFAAKTRSWAAATAHYTILLRLSRADGEIETTLGPVRAFFARPRKKKAEATSDGSPGAEGASESAGSAGTKTTHG